MTKTIDEPADLAQEVVVYYKQLVENDEDVRKQVARMTTRAQKEAGGLFKLWEEPRAVEWLPFSETRGDKGDTAHGRFLVFQLAGRWRTKDSDAYAALVSEFDVNYDGPNGKLSMTFLGFRNIAKTPVAPVK